MSDRSHLEETLAFQLRALGLPEPEREYRFHPKRRWRFDLAWPEVRLAVEVDGGIWTRGRHVRPCGYEADCRKYNAAVLAGWTVLRVTAGMVRSGEAVELVRQAIDVKEANWGRS